MQNFSVLLSWENCLIFFPDLLSREIAAYPGVKHIADRFDGQVKIIELAKKNVFLRNNWKQTKSPEESNVFSTSFSSSSSSSSLCCPAGENKKNGSLQITAANGAYLNDPGDLWICVMSGGLPPSL